MLVIHPTDPTTEVLKALYDKESAVTVVNQSLNNGMIRHLLHYLPKSERLMLLGHGSPNGLFSRHIESGEFDRIIVGHPHAYYLRGRVNIIAIFCNADKFAQKEGLHGLYSGMIVSEMEEAIEYGISTSAEEIATELPLFVSCLRDLLDTGVPLSEIPQAMAMSSFHDSELNNFNYNNLHFL